MKLKRYGIAAMVAGLLGTSAWMIFQPSLLRPIASPARQAKPVEVLKRPAHAAPRDAFESFADWQEKFREAPPLAQAALIASGGSVWKTSMNNLIETPRLLLARRPPVASALKWRSVLKFFWSAQKSHPEGIFCLINWLLDCEKNYA